MQERCTNTERGFYALPIHCWQRQRLVNVAEDPWMRQLQQVENGVQSSAVPRAVVLRCVAQKADNLLFHSDASQLCTLVIEGFIQFAARRILPVSSRFFFECFGGKMPFDEIAIKEITYFANALRLLRLACLASLIAHLPSYAEHSRCDCQPHTCVAEEPVLECSPAESRLCFMRDPDCSRCTLSGCVTYRNLNCS